jgi:hypothetical protein
VFQEQGEVIPSKKTQLVLVVVVVEADFEQAVGFQRLGDVVKGLSGLQFLKS